MKQKLSIAQWDLNQLVSRMAVIELPATRESAAELDDLSQEMATLQNQVVELGLVVAERQAKVDELTTDLKAGEPE